MDREQLTEVVPEIDPFALFDLWFADARAGEPNDANAMALATATPDGLPSVRMVLLKGHGPDAADGGGAGGGFVFYTNAQSRKGGEIMANPQAALLFHWKSLRRQIRIEGALTQVSDADADNYFHSRARDSQLGAVASAQSAPLDARATFLAGYEAAKALYGDGPIERPAHWTGFRLTPRVFEFWHDRPYRLHERRQFVRGAIGDDAGGAGWSSMLLYP